MTEGKTYIPRKLSEAVKDWEDDDIFETIMEINSRSKWDVNEATLVLKEELQQEWSRRGRTMLSKLVSLRRSGIDSSRPVCISRASIAAAQSRNAGAPSDGVKKELQKSQ
jgi:hypothetical protein